MARTASLALTGAAGTAYRREFREALDDDYQFRVERVKEEIGDLIQALRTLDPNGWSDWYDQNVPDWRGWLNAGPAMGVMRDRVCELYIAHLVLHTPTLHPLLPAVTNT